MIKNGIKHAEEMKELTNSQVKSKFRNDLIMKNKINNRIKKDFDGYYGKNMLKGVKDIRYLFNEEDESAHEDITYLFNESPFKSIITDIRSNLSKRGHKLIKNGLKYAEEMKDLTYSQVKSFKEKLIKFNNDLIKKNKIKKDFDDYYEKHKIKAVEDVKYLSDDFVYEDIRCLFKKLMKLKLMRLNIMRLDLMRLIILTLNLTNLYLTTLNLMRLNLMRITVLKILKLNFINFLII